MTSNGLKLTVHPPDGPARQGFPAALEVRVDNEGTEPLLLERAWGDGPLDGEIVWRRPPSGVIAYDAAQDCYRWRTGFTTTARVPLCSGLLPPGGGCEGFLPLKTLAPGERQVTIRARGVRLPAGELAQRVYAAADELQGAVVEFHRVATDGPFPTGSLIVRARGCAAAEAAVELAILVAEDEDDPAAAALERIGGGRLVDRCRALGGAWVLEDAAGATHLVRGERTLRCGRVGAGLWRLLDAALPFEPLRVRLVGAASALEEQAELGLNGPAGGEKLLERRAAWELLAACAARGLVVEPAEHTAITHGVRVRPA